MQNTPWLVVRKPNPLAALRLFCFPYSGGGASVFHTWAEQLPVDVEVYAVQLPGRETRLAEPSFTRLTPLIEALTAALQPHLDKPFAFFGHSLGALISFELARALHRDYTTYPVHLWVSGHGAPQVHERQAPIYGLPEPEFITALRAYNGIPEEVLTHAELRELILPILRADFELFDTYTHEDGEPLPCAISAYGGLDDPSVPTVQLAGWREQTAADFTQHLFPGDHFYLNTARPLLLQTLRDELAQVLNRLMIRSYL